MADLWSIVLVRQRVEHGLDEVFSCLIGAGLSNKEIATHLFVAETTIKTHVRALLTKLDCRDRVALVRVALHV